MNDEPAWRPTTAFVVAVTVGSVLLIVATATRRPALALCAVPLLTDAAWCLRRVVRAPLRVTVRPGTRRLREGDPVDVRIDVDAPADADAVLVVVETEPLLTTAESMRPVTSLPTAASRTLAARAGQWGRASSAHVFAVGWAGHGLLRSTPAHGTGDPVVVEPAAVPVAALRPRTRTGVVGPRPSRRTGSGSELTGVRPFVAGDRLRHVHWRVTARRGDLHVTTTAADREASLLLAVDTGSEFGPRTASTLDVAVRVAAALARTHLHDGDRVGFVDLADPTRVLRPGTGHRQLDRVVDRLVPLRRSSPADLRRLPAVVARTAPGATVVVLSPLLRPAVGLGVAHLAQSGIAVSVIDTFDRDVDRTRLPAATRLWLLDRDATIDSLVDVGVTVRPWK